MSPDETINVLRETLKQCVTEVPDTMLTCEPEEYWTDLVARFVFKLSSRGLYIVEREAYDLVRTAIANGRYGKVKEINYVSKYPEKVGKTNFTEAHVQKRPSDLDFDPTYPKGHKP